jgi:hypothetical protein
MASVLADGDMEAAGVAAWTSANATMSKSGASPHGGAQALRLAKTLAGASALAYPHPIDGWVGGSAILHSVFALSGYALSGGVVAPRVAQVTLAGGTEIVWTGTTSTSQQSFSVVVHSGLSNAVFYLLSQPLGAIGDWVEFDDLTLEPLGAYAPWLHTILGV